MEVAGAVLAILPLLVSVTKHYEDCSSCIKRYRSYSSHVKQFQQRLTIQRTIFRNQCRILLEDAVDHETVNQMLGDTTHQEWMNQILDKKVLDLLGISRDACVIAIEEISRILTQLGSESRKLDDAVEQDLKSSVKVNLRAWEGCVKKKVKFSLSKARLDEALSELTSLNGDFRTLSSQVLHLAARSTSQQSRSHTRRGDPEVQKFRMIRQASQKVYEALGRSCTKHTEHFSHFCLEADASEGLEAPQVQFRLAFAHFSSRGTPDAKDPVFFAIKSTLAKSLGPTCSRGKMRANDTINTLKRTMETSSSKMNKKPKKTVRFDIPTYAGSVDLLPQVQQVFVAAAPRKITPLKNLCRNRNLCDQLKASLQQAPVGYSCLGMLDSIDCFQHLVYTASCATKQQSPGTSLEQIISVDSKQAPLGRISQYERVHLAKSLAIGVLQYHATPWLQMDWRSEDIYFFDLDTDATSLDRLNSLSVPYLNVSVKNLDTAPSRAATYPPPHLPPNMLLFSLGVVLLEIAYNATLESLTRQKDREHDDDRYTQFFVAKRLAGLVSKEMGIRYKRIVEKCLGCHFASGSDLDDEGLQLEFHNDVVKELEEIELEFRGLQLG